MKCAAKRYIPLILLFSEHCQRSGCPQGLVVPPHPTIIRSVSPNQDHLSCTYPSRGPWAVAQEPLNQHWVSDHRERWAAVPHPSLHRLSPVIVVTHQQLSTNCKLGGSWADAELSILCAGGLPPLVCLRLVCCHDPDSNPLSTVDEGCFLPRGQKWNHNGTCSTFIWGWRGLQTPKQNRNIAGRGLQYDSLFSPLIKSFSCFDVIPLIHSPSIWCWRSLKKKKTPSYPPTSTLIQPLWNSEEDAIYVRKYN